MSENPPENRCLIARSPVEYRRSPRLWRVLRFCNPSSCSRKYGLALESHYFRRKHNPVGHGFTNGYFDVLSLSATALESKVLRKNASLLRNISVRTAESSR